MIISLIAAMSKNGVIGKGNKLPWDLPADMDYFQAMTRRNPVIIMGRNTFQSIGHPLRDRQNIILTSDREFRPGGCTVVHSIEDAITAAGDAEEVMVIGGSSIYEQFLPIAHRIYLTIIDHEFEGDAYFPEFDRTVWKEVSRMPHEPHGKNQYPYAFLIFEHI